MGIHYQVNEWPSYRINHARTRHKQLMGQVRIYRDSMPYSASLATGTKGDRVISSLTEFREPDFLKMAMLVGEIANALRGALDSVVWQLVAKHYGAEIAKQVHFPIVDLAPLWQTVSNKVLGNAELPLNDRIEFCQPFTLNTGYPRHPLSVLRDLSNTDKHRDSIALSGRADSGANLNVEFDKPGVDPRFESWLSSPTNYQNVADLQVGAVLFDAVVPNYVKVLSVEAHLELDFGVDLDGDSVLPFEHISRIIEYVQQVIWYLLTGAHEYETYLRRPREHGPTVDI